MLLPRLLFRLPFLDLISPFSTTPALFRSRSPTGLKLVSLPVHPVEKPMQEYSVHIFLNHDPHIASVFFPDSYAGFPESAWKLDPLVPIRRPQSTPESHNYPPLVDLREALGRYILSDTLLTTTKLQEILEIFIREAGIEKTLLAQFTIFPQSHNEDGDYPPFNDTPLPWTLTLAEISALDLDALDSPKAPLEQTSPFYAPVLHLVLETKAAALARIAGPEFLPKEFGYHYQALRDIWSRHDSLWHSRRYLESGSCEVVAALTQWRKATHTQRYVRKARENGDSTLEKELDTKRKRLQEIESMTRGQTVLRDLSGPPRSVDLRFEAINLRKRIKQIEANQDDGLEARTRFSTFLSAWNQWVMSKNMSDPEISLIEDGQVENSVMTFLRQRQDIIREWSKSPQRTALAKSIKEEHFRSTPWMTPEEREREEKWRADAHAAYSAPRTTDDRSTEPVGDATEANSDPSVIQVLPMRLASSRFSEDLSSFTIQSGTLSWGQILPLYYSTLTPNLTSNAARLPQSLPGGTIIQHRYSYRSAARNGLWKVRRYYSASRFEPLDPDDITQHAGWLLYHESVDPMDMLAQARALDGGGPGAISNRNAHSDKDVLYIGRYDWSHHFGRLDMWSEFQEWAEPAIGPLPEANAEDAFHPHSKVEPGGYLLALDSEDFDLDFVRAYKQHCDTPVWGGSGRGTTEKVFRRQGRSFGAYLSMPLTEYEFGWLVFSGQRHADHDADELVAIVYDATYESLGSVFHALEGDTEAERILG